MYLYSVLRSPRTRPTDAILPDEDISAHADVSEPYAHHLFAEQSKRRARWQRDRMSRLALLGQAAAMSARSPSLDDTLPPYVGAGS